MPNGSQGSFYHLRYCAANCARLECLSNRYVSLVCSGVTEPVSTSLAQTFDVNITSVVGNYSSDSVTYLVRLRQPHYVPDAAFGSSATESVNEIQYAKWSSLSCLP